MNLSLKSKAVIKITIFLVIGILIFGFLPEFFWNAVPDHPYFRGAAKGGMVSVAILLLMSYVFLKSDNKSLGFIGVEWKRERLYQLIAGLILGVLMCAVSAWLLSLLFDFRWQINPKFDIGMIFLGLWLSCWSAISEELIYRGYAFKKLLVNWGVYRSIISFTFIFAIIHWFGWGVWGDIAKMFSVLFTVGLGALIFSLAFIKTQSIALPIGLHVGFIWANADLFTGMFARWYNNEQGLFYAVGTTYYSKVSNNWLLINIPYCIVLLISIGILHKIKRPHIIFSDTSQTTS